MGLLVLSRSSSVLDSGSREPAHAQSLIAQFVWVYAVRRAPRGPVLLTAALLAIQPRRRAARHGAALAHLVWLSLSERGFRSRQGHLVGFSPWLAWEAFSLFNTASRSQHRVRQATGPASAEVARQASATCSRALLGCALWSPSASASRWPSDTAVPEDAAGAGRDDHNRLRGEDRRRLHARSLPYLADVLAASLTRDLGATVESRRGWRCGGAFRSCSSPSAVERYPTGDFHWSGIADERTYYRESTALLSSTARTAALASLGEKRPRRGAPATRGGGAREHRVLRLLRRPEDHILDSTRSRSPARAPAFSLQPRVAVGTTCARCPRVPRDGQDGKCVMPDANLVRVLRAAPGDRRGRLLSFSRSRPS